MVQFSTKKSIYSIDEGYKYVLFANYIFIMYPINFNYKWCSHKSTSIDHYVLHLNEQRYIRQMKNIFEIFIIIQNSNIITYKNKNKFI